MNGNNNNDLFVIGAGQMRTGTKSLKLALEKLYNGDCYHMAEIFERHQEHIPIWISVFDKGSLDKFTAKKIFSGYCATVDFPSTAVYKDLMNIYPDSKVVLTTRNTNDWLKSVKNTTMHKNVNNIFIQMMLWITPIGKFSEFFNKLIFHSYKQSYDILRKDDSVLQKCYEKFNQEVREIVPKERLLEFNIKDGWEPLCKFLNLPIPSEPFPFVNTTEQFNQNINLKMSRNVKLFAIVSLIIVGGSVIIMKYFTN